MDYGLIESLTETDGLNERKTNDVSEEMCPRPGSMPPLLKILVSIIKLKTDIVKFQPGRIKKN